MEQTYTVLPFFGGLKEKCLHGINLQRKEKIGVITHYKKIITMTTEQRIETKRVSDSTAISVSNIAKHAEDSLKKEFNKTGCTL